MPILKNARHERFAQELANGKLIEEAHRLAGFKADRRNAQRLRERDDIVRRIDAILTARQTTAAKVAEIAVERAAITKHWVIDRLRENVERAMTAEPVRDAKGEPTGEYTYAGAVANKALELLGREIGMFINRSEHTGKDGEKLIPDELVSSSKLALALLGVLRGTDKPAEE